MPTVKTLSTFILLATGRLYAQFAYPNCAAISDKDFSATTLVSKTNDVGLFEPLKMDFSMSDQGVVDIFFIERGGSLKMYSGTAKTVRTLGNVAPETRREEGLSGMALDPDFRKNKRLYLYYAHASGFRVSRFNLDPATSDLLPASEKVLLTIPSGRGRTHTAGAMRFDAYGDLYIAVGDNESLLKGPANTADLRGGILRIHPREDGGYSIPKGNLWETASAYFQGKGKADVAAMYKDSTRAKREVFVKGTRDAYTLTLDPVRRWVTWGDCGPDQEAGNAPDTAHWTEEHNIATAPGFYGWPFWTATNHVQTEMPVGYAESGEAASWKDWTSQKKDAPINDLAGLNGIADLPPAQPGTHVYAHACAMTGPIYQYDGDLDSKVKMPPSFNRMWIVTDFDKGTLEAIPLNAAGKQSGAAVKVFTGVSQNFNRPLDLQQGPDGALYYLNYSCGTWYASDKCTGIYRIEYNGACQDPTLKPELPTSATLRPGDAAWARLAADKILLNGFGGCDWHISDVAGRVLRSFSTEASGEFATARLLDGVPPGLYFVRIENAGKATTLSIPKLP
jgi:cytochrome c